MKKIIVLAVILGTLTGGVARATTLPVACLDEKNSTVVACTNLNHDQDEFILYGQNFWPANEVQANMLRSYQGLQVIDSDGQVSTPILSATDATITNLEVTHNGIFGGNLDVAGYIRSAIGVITTLIVNDVISFAANPYASIKAFASTLSLTGSTISFTRWNGNGACHFDKSLPDGTAKQWRWLGDDGLWHSSQTPAGVPTQCLNNN